MKQRRVGQPGEKVKDMENTAQHRRRDTRKWWVAMVLVGIAVVSPVRTQAQWDGHTQQTRQITIIQDLGNVDFAFGTSLIIRVLNPLPPPLRNEDPQRSQLLFDVTVFDLDGSILLHSEEVTVPSGEFHSFDFDLSPLTTGVATGRVTVRADVRVRHFGGITSRISQGDLDPFLVIAEVR
jgi:hypothetical protein